VGRAGVTGPGFFGGLRAGPDRQVGRVGAECSTQPAAGSGSWSRFSIRSGQAQAAPIGPIVHGRHAVRPVHAADPNTAQQNIETGPIMKLLAHL
jgi:hypothetical protein